MALRGADDSLPQMWTGLQAEKIWKGLKCQKVDKDWTFEGHFVDKKGRFW